MNALLIGNGAREHALAEAITQSGAQVYAYLSSKNPGILSLAGKSCLGSYADLKKIRGFAREHKIDLALIGPEAPLEHGVVDDLGEEGIVCFGPRKELAKLETSKSFTRELLAKHGIAASPQYRIFEDPAGIAAYLRDLGSFVIKPDGLTAGKGVQVSGEHFQSVEDGFNICEQILKTHPRVVIEEKLEGEEFSLHSLTDGKKLIHCPAVQDHKRAFEGDTGPNTGGMGSYSDANHSLPFLAAKDIDEAREINEKVCKALKKETGEYYRGVMYGGFMATADGVKVIEYNARFGDPEAMNILPLLESDFALLCMRAGEGSLSHYQARFAGKATVCKYVVPQGYPNAPVQSTSIRIGNVPTGVRTYYASVEKAGQEYTLGRSRSVAFVGIADSLREAEHLSTQGCLEVRGPVRFRRDIGTPQALQKRITHLQWLRRQSSEKNS